MVFLSLSLSLTSILLLSPALSSSPRGLQACSSVQNPLESCHCYSCSCLTTGRWSRVPPGARKWAREAESHRERKREREAGELLLQVREWTCFMGGRQWANQDTLALIYLRETIHLSPFIATFFLKTQEWLTWRETCFALPPLRRDTCRGNGRCEAPSTQHIFSAMQVTFSSLRQNPVGYKYVF